jgi:PAS domain S-box-containing protein
MTEIRFSDDNLSTVIILFVPSLVFFQQMIYLIQLFTPGMSNLSDHQRKTEELKKALTSGVDVFKDHIEGLALGVGLYDANAAPFLCNEAAFALLGMTEDQFLGKSAMDPFWSVIHRDGSDFPMADFPIIQAITTYKPIHHVIMGVYRPSTKDRVWLEVNTEPILDRVGDILHVICTFTDITKEID